MHSTASLDEPSSLRQQPRPGRVLLALALGIAAGVLTSLLQKYLDYPWLALVNAASPWLTTAFVAGALQSRLPTAVVMGISATVLQVVASS